MYGGNGIYDFWEKYGNGKGVHFSQNLMNESKSRNEWINNILFEN